MVNLGSLVKCHKINLKKHKCAHLISWDEDNVAKLQERERSPHPTPRITLLDTVASNSYGVLTSKSEALVWGLKKPTLLDGENR